TTLACACARKPASTTDADRAILEYGYGPEPNARVTYQPDVIVVGGGPQAIRGVEAGLRWILDANAPGARDLAPGKVMFVTSRALGRVIEVESRGSTLAVRVAPVGLTEVLRDAQIDFDRAIPFESLRFYRLDAIAPPVAQNADDSSATLRPVLWYHEGEQGSA